MPQGSISIIYYINLQSQHDNSGTSFLVFLPHQPFCLPFIFPYKTIPKAFLAPARSYIYIHTGFSGCMAVGNLQSGGVIHHCNTQCPEPQTNHVTTHRLWLLVRRKCPRELCRVDSEHTALVSPSIQLHPPKLLCPLPWEMAQGHYPASRETWAFCSP